MGRERRPADPAVVAFYANLQAAFTAAGPPPYPRLVAIMLELQAKDPARRALGKSALHGMLTGKNATLPRWDVLSAVIRALHVAAEETGLDASVVGSLVHWKQQLAAAGSTPATPHPAPLTLEEPELFSTGVILAPSFDDAVEAPEAFTTGAKGLDREGELLDLMTLAQDEDDPDHAEAAYALAVLALCAGQKSEGKRWLMVAARTQYQPARVLLTSRTMDTDARAAALHLAARYDSRGATYLARQLYRAARTRRS